MEEILSYEKFCEQKGLDQSKAESVERYKLYLEVVEYMGFEFLEDFVNQEH